MSKITITGILFFISITTFSQAQDLELLEKQRNELVDEIVTLQKELKTVVDKITVIKSQKVLENITEEPVFSIAKVGGNLRDKQGIFGDIIMVLEKDTPVKVLGFKDNYFEVCLDNTCGFLNQSAIKPNEGTKKIIQESEELKFAEDQGIIQEKTQIRYAEAIALDKKMLKKYGEETYDLMKERKFWIGMNKEMLLFALGEPININKSVGSWGTHEQWIYQNGLYVYVENNKVTSYQN